MGTPPTSEARARSNSSRERGCSRAKRSSSAAWTAARRSACIWVTGASLWARDRVAQRPLEISVAEGVAALERAYRHRALAGGDDLGHVAVERPDREAGDGGEGGPVQGVAEGARELAVGDRLGRARVARALPGRVVERGEVEADDVVRVDPRHVLAPTGDGPADAKAEEGEHLGQRAAPLVERHARSQHGHPQPMLGGAGGLTLPRHTHAGEEVTAGRGVLGDGLAPARPVVAD